MLTDLERRFHASTRASEQATWNANNAYHGGQEGYGRVFFGLALLEGLAALALPWLDIELVAHGTRAGHLLWLAILTDLLGGTAMLAFAQVYRRLSSRIARGGPEAADLDRIRMRIAIMAGSLLCRLDAAHVRGVGR